MTIVVSEGFFLFNHGDTEHLELHGGFYYNNTD
jgi:hypothetical protein